MSERPRGSAPREGDSEPSPRGEAFESIGPERPPTPLAESNSFRYLGLRVTQYALLFAGTVIVTRQLGPVGRAQYALPLALAGAVWVLGHLTLELASSRLLARRERTLEQIVPALSLCTLVLSGLMIAVALAIGLSQREDLLGGATETMVVLAALTIPFLLASQMAGQLLLFLGRLRAHGAANAAGAAVQFVLVIGLLLADSITPTSAIAAALAGFATVGVILVVLLARASSPRLLLPRPDGSVLRPMVRTGAMLHPASVGIQLMPRLDLILVAALLSTEAAGLFSLALVLADAMLLVSQAFSMSAVPRQLGDDDSDAARFTLDFARQSLLFALAAVVGASIVAYPFVTLVYGSDFAGAVVPFVIVMFGLVATAIENPCRVLLVRIASPWLVSALVCSALALNAVATVALVQVLSISGAAIAVVIAYWFLALATLRLVGARTGHPIRSVLSPPHRDDELVRRLHALILHVRPGRDP